MPKKATDAFETERESASAPGARGRRAGKIAALGLVMLALVVLPFVLFGEPLDRLARSLIADPSSRLMAGLAGGLLLAADIVLPVPSTIVISGLGALLGLVGATAIAAAGLTLGCAAGYWLGRRLGHDFAERAMGAADFAFLSARLDRYGVLILAICRPVPILAEASVIAAGVAGLSAGKVLIVTTLANIGFAAVYAALGAAADTGAGLVAAVVASMGLPLAGLLAAKAWKRRASSAQLVG